MSWYGILLIVLMTYLTGAAITRCFIQPDYDGPDARADAAFAVVMWPLYLTFMVLMGVIGAFYWVQDSVLGTSLWQCFADLLYAPREPTAPDHPTW